MGIREAIKNINLTHGESYFNAVRRDDWDLPIPKNRRKFFNKIKKKEKSNWRRAARCLFVQELLKGLSYWPPVREIQSHYRLIYYRRESIIARARNWPDADSYSFNPRVSFVGLSTCARPYSFSFARHRRRRCRRQPEWPSAPADMYIYVYTSPQRHAKRPPGNFYSSDPGPRDSLEWSDRNLSSAFSRSASPRKSG